MILVANGCSHTCGAEMEYPGQRACVEKAWPKHLADNLNCDYVNLADSGGSAHRVVRTTVRYIIDSFSKKKKLDDHYFVIMWPGIYRDEIAPFNNVTKEEESTFYDDGWLQIIVGNDSYYKKTFSKRMFYYFKAWVIGLEPLKSNMDYLHNILLLQNFFTLYKIKYLFWTASHSVIDISHKDLKGYLGLINKKYFPYIDDITQSYNVLMKNNNQLISKPSMASGFGSHYDEPAQIWFANYLYNYIQSNSLVT
jgi:hypothetical protein